MQDAFLFRLAASDWERLYKLKTNGDMIKLIIPLISMCILLFSCDSNNQDGQKGHDKTSMFDNSVPAGDPLPSWNDGRVKKGIIRFVSKATTVGDSGFIPAENRIATFDNDGTLWAEKPYVQEMFTFYRVKKMIEADPSLAERQPFKAVAEGDIAYFREGGDSALMSLAAMTNTGMNEDEFEAMAKQFFAIASYPGRNVSLKRITYKPQLELLNYLRANGFKVFIVTGGTIEFVRVISYELYGVPKENVVGTTFKYRFIDSNRSVMREPELALLNDKEAKPVGIQSYIGQRPVFACGNEGGAGDIAMLKYSQGNKLPSFQMVINHDDSAREYYYQENDNATLNAAKKNNWNVVSMKRDWKTIFPE